MIKNRNTNKILDKIKDLQECTTRELENVIEDLLPQFQIMLHPSHPAYKREYPIASTEFTSYGRMDHPEKQLEKKTGLWSRQLLRIFELLTFEPCDYLILSNLYLIFLSYQVTVTNLDQSHVMSHD
jgi:hypothetical protein